MLGGQAGTLAPDRELPGFPGGISGTELTSRAVTQARKFRARTATPYRASTLWPERPRHRVARGRVRPRSAVVVATGAEYRRLPVADLEDYEGISVFYAAGPPEAQPAAARASASSAAATLRRRRRSGWRAAAHW